MNVLQRPNASPQCGPLTSVLAATFASVVMLTACAGVSTSAPASPPPTLYERLGGAPVITAAVDRIIERSAHDPRTQRSFDGIRLSTLKLSVASHLCVVADGPCKYEGETMQRSHQALAIQPSEFDAFVTIVREELDRAGVRDAEKNDLLRRLAPMRRDIVAASMTTSAAAPKAAP